MGCESIMPTTGLKASNEGRVPCNGITTSQPLKEGSVRMVQQAGNRTITAHVTLKVYSNNYDTFAVIAMDKTWCKDYGYISLKNCSVERVSVSQNKDNRYGFQISQRKLDLDPVVFYVSDSKEVEQWISVVSGNSSQVNKDMEVEFRRPLTPLGQKTPRSRTGSISSSRPNSQLLLPALTEEGTEE